jgi:hypothetical protein
MTLWQIILLVVIVALVAAVVAAVHVRRGDIKKVGYMMDALEDGELNSVSRKGISSTVR